jgi:pSer/pThr/pTyr-binding forkhead associated (FHA) protein
MAKVILSLEGSVIREMNLDKERVTIGRKPQNDIQIENLAVSSEHARIVTILNDSFLEDLGSTNGTLVNGNPIKKHILQNNDEIEIGKYTLRFVSDTSGVSQPAPEDFERTMVLRVPSAAQRAPAAPVAAPAPVTPAAPMAPARELRADTMTRVVAATQPAPMAPVAPAAPELPAGTLPRIAAASVAPAMAAPVHQQAFIQIMSGPGVGREAPLLKSLTTLGKTGVQVAVITKRPQGYFITHVEGANHPVLNGKMLDAQAHALNDHDLIEIAGVKMEFFFRHA